MPVIKRYPNRKLYDTQARQYITLDGIAELIRQGEEVRVVDYGSGEDLTTLTLTQIVFEKEKKQSGFLPQTVLTGLVQAGGNTLSALQHTLTSSLGLSRQVDEEIERRIQALMAQGELTKEEGDRWRRMLLTQAPKPAEAQWPSDQDLEHALERHGVPTRDDLQQLAKQIDVLTAKLKSAKRSKKSA